MQALATLFEQHPLIALHLACALLALLAGSVLMSRPKGTQTHRALGWAFVALLGVATLSSAFIRDQRLPNLAGFTAIHLLTVVTAVFLPLGVWHIRHGQLEAHRRTMTRLFIGACVVAGLFALVPGRFLGDLLWKQGVGLQASR